MFSFITLVLLGLGSCSGPSDAEVLGRPRLFGPEVVLDKEVEELNCEVLTYPKNESILLQLFKEGDRSRLLAENPLGTLEGEMVVFPLVISLDHDGNLECVASVQNNSLVLPTVSRTHHLRVIQPVKGAGLILRSGVQEFFEGAELWLQCNVTAGTHVTYSWLLNGSPVGPSPRHHLAQDYLRISRTTAQDSGAYQCTATNQLNSTQMYNSTSPELHISVREPVSDPDISFRVLWEKPQDYFAEVTCASSRGTPPVTFSLHNRTGLVNSWTSSELSVAFVVPLVLNSHMGWLRCHAHNDHRVAHSQWIPLEVAPVRGPLTLRWEPDVGEDFAVVALRLFCSVPRGTFPQYHWFLNGTRLDDHRTQHWIAPGPPPLQSVLVLPMTPGSAGTYHCEVKDSFGDSAPIRSQEVYLDREELNRLPVHVVAVVLGCFLFLVSVVTLCCGFGVVLRRRHYGEKTLLEKDAWQYAEDAEVVAAARGGEPQEGSSVSSDEWPHIQEALSLSWSLEEWEEEEERL